MRLLCGFIVFLSLSGPALGDTKPPADMPDYAAMDKEVLVLLIQNQHHKIQQLQAEIAKLEAVIAEKHGGADATVSGGVTRIDNGSWVVRVESVSKTDTSAWEADIRRLNKRLLGSTDPQTGRRLDGLDDRVDDAKKALASVQDRGKYKKVTSHGNVDRSKSNLHGYTDKELADAKRAVGQAEREKGAVMREIKDLQRRVDVGRSSTTIIGTVDGLPVTVIATGPSASAARIITGGNSYTIVGKGTFTSTEGEIVLRSAAPAPVEVVDPPS